MKLKSPFGGAVHPALYAGAYTALKLGAKKVTRISGKKEKTALPNLRRFDYGLAFGVETEWRRLLLDVRLNLGLADVMTELDGAARLHQHEGTVKNLTPVVMTGFRF
jgi:hypothetical protein